MQLIYLILFCILLLIYLIWRYLIHSKKSHNRGSSGNSQYESEPQALSDPVSQANEAGDKDAWEGWFIEDVTDPKPVDAKLRILYVDGNGNSTERNINVIEFENSPSKADAGMIMAHCLLRDATRTFRYNRIKHAVDLETGEVITDVQCHLRNIWTGSPAYAVEQFQEQFQGPLEILLFVARADGRLAAKERAVILDFCKRHVPDQGVTDDDLTKSIKNVRSLSLHSFKVASGRLLKQRPELANEVIKAAELIVGAEKTIHPAEVEAIEYIKKRLTEQGGKLASKE